ncbi:MAG TPA: hypothetical protein VFI22_00805, partial [Thermomicrobiales bacterium]|nr:hypothetical protein [Thermomicrobiales bacterium]
MGDRQPGENDDPGEREQQFDFRRPPGESEPGSERIGEAAADAVAIRKIDADAAQGVGPVRHVHHRPIDGLLAHFLNAKGEKPLR